MGLTLLTPGLVISFKYKVPFDEFGVIYNDGKNVYMKGFKSYAVDKITEQELRDLQNDFDPIEAPPGPYKVQPEYQGRRKKIYLYN